MRVKLTSSRSLLTTYYVLLTTTDLVAHVEQRALRPIAVGHGHGQVDNLVPDRVGALLLRGGGSEVRVGVRLRGGGRLRVRGGGLGC